MAKPLRMPREDLPGRQRPYRPCPADFRERYVELGWEEIGEHYRAGWPVIARWIDECGRAELTEARAAYVHVHGRRPLHVVHRGRAPGRRPARGAVG
jgi:hypothetical protein